MPEEMPTQESQGTEQQFTENKDPITELAASAMGNNGDQSEDAGKFDTVKAETIGGAINENGTPLDRFRADEERYHGITAFPTREALRSAVVEGEKFIKNAKGADRHSLSDHRERINRLASVYEVQDAFIDERTQYYEALYEANPEKFAKMPVAEFLEIAKQEQELTKEADKQEFILVKIIQDALVNLDDLEKRYKELDFSGVSNMDATQFAQFGEKLAEITTEIKYLPARLGGLSYAGQTAGPSWGHDQEERKRRAAWFGYKDKYAAQVDRFRDKLNEKLDTLKPTEVIAEVRTFATRLEEKQSKVLQGSLDKYNELIAGIKDEPWPKVA